MNENLWAVGDTHGNYDVMQRMIKELRAAGATKLIFLGDYIDRGPDSAKIVEWLMNDTEFEKVCLKGNHEDMMVRAVFDHDRGWEDSWFWNGGHEAVKSFDKNVRELETDPRALWIKDLPHYHIEDGILFVHAGVVLDPVWAASEFRDEEKSISHTDPEQCVLDNIKLIDQEGDDSLLWIRSWFHEHAKRATFPIVFGHTPWRDGPRRFGKAIGIDTACAYGEKLTAYNPATGNIIQVDV